MKEEWAEEQVEVLELALNVVKKVTCLESALLQVNLHLELEVGLVSNVVKRDICHENVLKLEKVEQAEVLEVVLEPALNVVRKDICLENALLLHLTINHKAVEHASNVEKKVT